MKPLANRSDVAMHPTAGPQSDRDRTVYLSTVQTTTHQKIVGIPSYGWLINSSSQLACSQLQNSHVLQVFNPFGKNMKKSAKCSSPALGPTLACSCLHGQTSETQQQRRASPRDHKLLHQIESCFCSVRHFLVPKQTESPL